MIRIRQLKLDIDHKDADLRKKICQSLRIQSDALISYEIVKQSIDARKKPELYYIYTVDVQVASEKKVMRKVRNNNIEIIQKKTYQIPESGHEEMLHRPVVIGSGPAGMFCAYLLAEQGYKPIVLERGACVEERTKDVEKFWETGILDTRSNVQFGEGGAGTFSDGKLNTLVKDVSGRNHKVLEIFVKNGASDKIIYENKPHIGTDVLAVVVKNMRNHIIEHGGEIRFHHQVMDVMTVDGSLKELVVNDLINNTTYQLETEVAVLAIGHSARDTFQMLFDHNFDMNAKAFAVGVRVQHLQETIDVSQYGRTRGANLPAAAYKLTANLENGRGVYTFCMCPGGYVVNASSEEEMLAINGMSYNDRAGDNANSAVIVSVRPADFPGEDALAGVRFQRELESKAFQAGNGKIPVQLFKDYCNGHISKEFGQIKPNFKGQYAFGNVRGIFPEEIGHSIIEALYAYDHKIKGFASDDVILAGVESRTSSPLRIIRDDSYQSNYKGIYPCGEGAGYAGGITSAAMDGLRVAEAIIQKYRPYENLKN